MDLDVEASQVLYGVGIFLGIISILYFGRQLIFDLSPTVKSFLFLATSVSLLGLAEYVRRNLFSTGMYILSATAYLVFLMYTFVKFSFTTTETFAALSVSSAIFIALGYIKDKKQLEIGKSFARNLVLGTVGISLLLIAFDAAGAQPTYELELKDGVEYSSGMSGSLEMGVVEVSNNFLLSREVELPDYEACKYDFNSKKRNIYLTYNDSGQPISGNSGRTLALEDNVRIEHEANDSVMGIYDIRLGEECPDGDLDAPRGTIVVYEGERQD